MKWTRAVHHLQQLAEECERTSTQPMFTLRLTALWAYGEVLDRAGQELETVRVALVVDAPDPVVWLDQPAGATHWANAVRLPQSPVLAVWRSAGTPVWNHEIGRPLLLWERGGGVVEEALDALRTADLEGRRHGAPAAEELRASLEQEAAASLVALVRATRDYDEKRWAPGKLERIADPLWRVAAGYVDLTAALGR